LAPPEKSNALPFCAFMCYRGDTQLLLRDQMPLPIPAMIDWVPTTGEDRLDPPRGPVLVRTQEPGRSVHVCLLADGLWRMSGAMDRVVYGVTDWALLEGEPV
jgi:hypothetical protein